jgi:L-asparaginase / beta-aspartyl-peptidase
LKPSLIIHGGAGNVPSDIASDCLDGIRDALDAGWKILSRNGAAIDAVEAAIVALEENPLFDAGYGSHLNRDGRVQLDAILMNGLSLKAGAVAAVGRVRNPIQLARLVLEKSEHMMFVGEGAEQFAREHGMPLCVPEELIAPRARAAWKKRLEAMAHADNSSVPQAGTVGAVALDSAGRLFAGTSTGGTPCKFPGRVGDSPLIGCGCYADAEAGGVSCTGYGEGIMKIVMAKMAIDLLANPQRLAPARSHDPTHHALSAHAESGALPEAVANACVRKLAERARAAGGLILLDREGRPAAAYNTPHMPHGYVAADGRFTLGM